MTWRPPPRFSSPYQASCPVPPILQILQQFLSISPVSLTVHNPQAILPFPYPSFPRIDIGVVSNRFVSVGSALPAEMHPSGYVAGCNASPFVMAQLRRFGPLFWSLVIKLGSCFGGNGISLMSPPGACLLFSISAGRSPRAPLFVSHSQLLFLQGVTSPHSSPKNG